MSSTLQRRLPGVRFDVPAPPLADALPRMDIAFFVGFTACGPLSLPVAVESLAEFEAVFGGEIRLLERADGRPVTGLLHPALRQFFSHGGRRAWVQRVAAAHARTTRFPLQQMLMLQRGNAAERWRAEPWWAAARSPGAWADGLQVGTRHASRPLAVSGDTFDGTRLSVRARGPLALAPGDTLQLALAEGSTLQGCVVEAGTVPGPSGSARLERALVLDRLVLVRRWDRTPAIEHAGWFEPVDRGDGTVQHQVAATGRWLGNGRLALDAWLPTSARLGPGEVMRIDVAGRSGPAWLVLDTVDLGALGDGGGRVQARLEGQAWQVPAVLPAAAVQPWIDGDAECSAEWLQAGLWAAAPDGTVARLDGLALAPRDDGAASLFALPDDEAYHAERARRTRGELAFEVHERDAAARPPERFPLASVAAPAAQAVLLPLGPAAGFARGLGARGLVLPPLHRDGLDRFGWDLFAEPALADANADTLADRAEALRLLGRTPRPLRGLHGLFGAAVDGPAEEPTLLVVPDAVQPGWRRKRRREPARQLHAPRLQPEAAPCAGFDDCARTPLAAPVFLPDADADPDREGRYRLTWTRPEPQVQFELQASSEADFAIATLAYAGTDTSFAATGQPRGVAYWRVRALDGVRTSPWSGVLEVRTGGSLYEVREWSAADLLALHRLMLRAAAGRGDVLALLGLPEHYRWADAIEHARVLRDDRSATLPPPLTADETRAHSHGALHHPWLLTRRVDDLVACPPDGAIAGQLAAGALARGAWLAVANRPLRDVVALGLAAGDDERQALLEAQVNPVVATPAGFVLGSTETLDLDPDWRPVNVRRLMALLRRAALRRGATYVFEPHGDTLRRTVERAFEALLALLFSRGAFAGRSAAEAFRVELGDDLNTPARRDAGEFRVDLKVAPSRPLTYLSVRLVRQGDRLAAQEQR